MFVVIFLCHAVKRSPQVGRVIANHLTLLPSSVDMHLGNV